MAETINFTAADVAALDAAIAGAELEIERNGTRVRFRSMEDLLRARAFAASKVEASSRKSGVFRFNFTTSRGD